MRKYKITESKHPKYPWLHRIQALTDVNDYEKGKWSAFAIPEKLKPPESYLKRQRKKKNQPER